MLLRGLVSRAGDQTRYRGIMRWLKTLESSGDVGLVHRGGFRRADVHNRQLDDYELGVDVGVKVHMKKHDPRVNDLPVLVVLLSDTQAQS